MKTTIDVPDELLRQTKAHAAMKGLTLREIVVHAMEQEIAQDRKSGLNTSPLNWMKEWDATSQRLKDKWKTNKSAVTLIREGRR